jgi:PAS domain-containing protein
MEEMHQVEDGDPNDEEDEHGQNAISKFFNTLQDGLVGVLYIMGKDMSGSYFIAVLSMFVDCAQLAALATPTLFGFSEMNEYLDPLHVFFNSFQFSQLSHLNYFFVPTALILVVGLFFNVLYVGYCWIHQMFNWLFIVRLLRASATILTGVLYIPILTIFAGTIHCAGLEPQQCMIFQPFVALCVVFFIPFALINTATFFDPRRDGEGPITMPHARVAVVHQLVRTALAILSATLPGFVEGSSKGIVTFWSILMTVLSGILVYSYVMLQPYYRHQFNSLRAALATIVFWYSFCFAISGFWDFNPMQHSPAVLFYGGLCIILPFMYTLVLWRKKSLTESFFPDESAMMFGDMESELRVRFLLEESAAEAQREQRQLGTTSRKKKGNLTTVHGKAAKWYSLALAIYPKSSLLCAMQAQFFIYEMDKPLLARKALLEAEARGAKLDIAFAIYKTKKYTEENASQNSDIMTWVACEKYWKLSKFYDRRCCMLLSEFWTRLGDSKLQIGAIQILADQIAVAIKEASSAYSRLIKLKPDDYEVLNIYAGFLDCIRNDPEQSKKFKTRAEVVRTRAGKETTAGKFNDSDCSILRVDASGTSQNGVILSANEVTGRIFNQPSSSLEGKVISSILLPPFTADFDDIMEAYLQQGSEEFFNETFKSFVYVNDHNVIMPCNLELKPFSTDGINFQVFVRVKQRPIASQIVLVDPETQRIIGVTAQARSNLLRQCALDPTELQNIEDVVPGYKSRRAEYMQKDGAILNLKFGEGVKLCIKSTRLHGPESPLIDELVFLFAAEGEGEGPVPLEVYHTDTEQREFETEGKSGDEEERAPLNLAALDPITEQSECSHDLSATRSGSDLDEYDGSDAGSQSDEKPPLGLNTTTKDKEELPAAVSNLPTNGRLSVEVVALEDDNSTENLPAAYVGSRESITESRVSISLGPSESQGSRAPSVASSATSGHSVAASRRVFLNSDGKLDPTLNRFRQLYRLFVFLTIIVIIGVYLIRDSQMQTQSNTLDFTPKSGVRRYLAVRIAYLAHSMYLIHLDIVLPSGFTEYECRKQLVKSANELQRLDSLLFEQKDRFEDELLHYYDSEYLWLIRIVEEPDATYRRYSMFDASIAFASGARFVAEKPLDKMVRGDIDIFFLVQNIVPHAVGDAHYPGFMEALNRTTQLFAQLSQQTQKSMDTVSVTLAATVLVGFFILLVVMLLPLARGIDKSRLEVFSHLISMPRSVYPAIAGRFSGRLLDVHDEMDGGEVEQTVAIDTAKQNQRNAKRKQHNNAGEDERSVAAVEAALRASSNKYQIIGKIGVSLLLLIAYFSCTLYWNFQTEHLLADAPYVADYSSLRRATMLLAITKIRMLEAGGTQYGGFDVSYKTVVGVLTELDNIQQGLLNGDENRHLYGIIHNTMDKTEHKTLLFEDGCMGMKVPQHTGIPCPEFMHGVVADGLLTAYRSWIRLALTYLHETHVDEGPISHSVTIDELHERLETIHFIELSDLEEFYLQPSLLHSIDFYIEYEHFLFHRIHQLSLGACLAVVFSLLFCFYYTTRMLYSLDNEIKRTRSLVFMIPDDILRTHPKVKAFIFELARRQAKASR